MPLAGSRRQACQEGGRQLPVGSLMNDHLNYAKAAKAAKAEAGSIRWYDWLNDSTVIRNCGGDKYRLQLEQASGRCLQLLLLLWLLLLHFSCSALLMYSNRALSAAMHAHTHVQTPTHAHTHTHTPTLLAVLSTWFALLFFFALFPFRVTMATSRLIVYPPPAPTATLPLPLPLLLALLCSSAFYAVVSISCCHCSTSESLISLTSCSQSRMHSHSDSHSNAAFIRQWVSGISDSFAWFSAQQKHPWNAFNTHTGA